jgi:2-dehydro-3-deoxyphosphogluconate aldolase/(4S)-4-hydroxy-2-oxoglutarate aldolase
LTPPLGIFRRKLMPNLKVIQKILDVGLVPVVRATSADEAIAVVEAIKAGGVSVI